MVDGATSRNVATSRVVHQSAGSGSATDCRVQRLGCLISACALGPDDGDGDTATLCFGDDVGGAAVSARWLAVPHGVEPVCPVEHGLAGGHVRLRGRFGVVEPADAGRLREQQVVAGMGTVG
jgi:hypothetical protein